MSAREAKTEMNPPPAMQEAFFATGRLGFNRLYLIQMRTFKHIVWFFHVVQLVIRKPPVLAFDALYKAERRCPATGSQKQRSRQHIRGFQKPTELRA